MYLFVEVLRNCMICVLALSVRKKGEWKRGEEKKKKLIGLIRVGRHSGWMFSGLMAF